MRAKTPILLALTFFFVIPELSSQRLAKVDMGVDMGKYTKAFLFPLSNNDDPIDSFSFIDEIIAPSLPDYNWKYDSAGKSKSIGLSALQSADLRHDLRARSRSMTYYSGNEPELYQKIRRGETPIENAYIEHLYLDSLTDSSGKNKIIPYTLGFLYCIIINITEPKGFGPSDDDRSRSGKFDSLIFRQGFYMENCVTDDFTFYRSIFQKGISIIDCFPRVSSLLGGNINFKDCRFEASCRINVYDLRPDLSLYKNTSTSTEDPIVENKWLPWIYNMVYGIFSDDSICVRYLFDNCSFNDTLNLSDPDRFTAMDVTNCNIHGHALFGGAYAFHKVFELDANPIIDPPYYRLYNLNLTKSRFFKGINFENSICIDLNCTDAYFADSLFLFNSIFKKKKQQGIADLFPKSYFEDNTVLVLGKENIYTLDSLQINPVTFERLTITNDSLTSGAALSIQELDNQQLFYNKLEKWVADRYPPEIATKIKAKLDHQALMIARTYHRQHIWSSARSAFRYASISLLEFLVGNGYQGEINFMVSALFFLGLFTLIYFIFFRLHVVNYILEQYESSPNQVRVPPSLVNFVRCFYLSFILFISPKYPNAIFRQRKSVFILFTLEWLIGFAMVVLFLVYIAAQYTFIKKLLGI